MRKSLLIGLVVCLLALGTMGAAFATGMNFTGVGALSQGTDTIPQVDVTSVSYNIDNYGSVTGVVLKFDTALPIGTEISVDLQDSTATSPGSKATAKIVLATQLPVGNPATITINPANNQVPAMDKIQVTVAM